MDGQILLLGDRLRKIRQERKMTQKEVGDCIGVKRSSMSSYEKNISIPNAEVLKSLCLLYKVSADYILGLSNEDMIPTHNLTQKQINILKDMADALHETQNNT